jgi:hypothetical protein
MQAAPASGAQQAAPRPVASRPACTARGNRTANRHCDPVHRGRGRGRCRTPAAQRRRATSRASAARRDHAASRAYDPGCDRAAPRVDDPRGDRAASRVDDPRCDRAASRPQLKDRGLPLEPGNGAGRLRRRARLQDPTPRRWRGARPQRRGPNRSAKPTTTWSLEDNTFGPRQVPPFPVAAPRVTNRLDRPAPGFYLATGLRPNVLPAAPARHRHDPES